MSSVVKTQKTEKLRLFFYIYRKLQDTGVDVTVIARGVAQNDELQYTDEVTLGRALVGRIPYTA